jgi:hypothetical protein
LLNPIKNYGKNERHDLVEEHGDTSLDSSYRDLMLATYYNKLNNRRLLEA